MSIRGREAVALLGLAALCIAGCSSNNGSTNSSAAPTPNTSKSPPPAKANSDGTVPSETGVEKEKPAPGKGNLQGRVLYNGKPVPGIQVRLCEKFSQFIGGCSGAQFTAKTGDDGIYVIKEVPPKTYEALEAKVFDTNYYVFATSGILSSAKYNVEPDKTFFAPDTNLFKSDLKLVSPKAGSKVGGSNIEVKWSAYPDAAYYKFSVQPDSSSGGKTEYDYINKRVDGLSYVLDKPLTPGTYSCKVVAYNGSDVKLSQSADDIKFAVVDKPGT